MADFLGSLRVLLEADTGQFSASLSDAARQVTSAQANINRSLAGIESSFKSLGDTISGVVAGYLSVTFIKSALDAGDAMLQLSKSTGIPAETLGQLALAAKQSGVSLDDVGNAIHKMQKNLSDAGTDGKTAAAAFQQMGLSVQDLLKQSATQQLESIADGVHQFGNEADRTRLLIDVFGKSGANMGGLMSQGAAGIREAIEQAQDFGITFDKDKQQALQDYIDKSALLTLKLQEMGRDGFLYAWEKASQFYDLLGRLFNEPGLMTQADTVKNAIAQTQEKITQLQQMAQDESSGGLGILASVFGDDKKVQAALAKEKSYMQDLQTQLDYLNGESAKKTAAATPGTKSLAAPVDTTAMDAYRQKLQDINLQIYDLTNNEDKASAEAEKIALAAGMIKFDNGMIEIPAQSAQKFADLNAQLRELYDRQDAQKIIDDSKTALDKYNDSMVEFNQLWAEGLLTTQQFDQAQQHAKQVMDQGQQSTKDANSAFKQFGLTMSSSLESAISGGKSLRDVLQGLAADIEKMFIRLTVTNPLSSWMSQAFGGSGGFSLSSLFGGGSQQVYSSAAAVGPFPSRPTGGSVSAGQLYSVNEYGQEFFRPDTNGSIIPLGGAKGAGGNTYNIDARGTDASVVQRLAAAIQSLAGPGVVEQRVFNAQRRGQLA